MYRSAGRVRVVGFAFLCSLLIGGAVSGADQVSTQGFITGKAAEAWDKWAAALQAILDRDSKRAESALGDLLALNPAALRVALLADHAVNRTPLGGAVLLFEQDVESKALGPNGGKVADLLAKGREQMNELDDTFYFCLVGRFDVADANLKALLGANPDPVAVLEFTDRESKRREIIGQLLDNAIVGDSARALLAVLSRGEIDIKADPIRIRENIERLGGTPRAYENAVDALRDSGEKAVPFIVQYLRDPAQRALVPSILRAMPLIDRPAVNPLVMALRIKDDTTKRYLIEALAKIGYVQAVPYLLQLDADPATSPEIKAAVGTALAAFKSRGVSTEVAPAEAFVALAEDYYADKPSLSADPRLDVASVWYWRDNLLENVEVPTPVFNEVMTMRCCEEALRLDPSRKPALALWLAANFRRVAQLPAGAEDATRPANYPTTAFFAQSAGAEYNLMALARALDGSDPAVALGAIEALNRTAGPASLTADTNGRLPLAEALSFPDRMVRIRAGLTLAKARPEKAFRNHQNLMPVLSEALMLNAGARNALVVDANAEVANAVGGLLRGLGYEVLIDAALLPGLEKARTQLPGLDLIVLSSDVREPTLDGALGKLRGEFRFGAVPVVVVTKASEATAVRDLVRGDHRLAAVPAEPTPEQLSKAIADVSQAVGSKAITPELGLELAREAAAVLRDLAISRNTMFELGMVEPALLVALTAKDADLRLLVAEDLGYLGSNKAQDAIARIALDSAEAQETRIKMYAALAEAAKRRGNLLSAETIQQITDVASKGDNLVLREAASRALGALNLPGTPASEIIRNQYQG